MLLVSQLKMGLHRSILELVVVLACSALLLPVAMAVEYVVGGPGGWTSVPTASHYTDWATEKHFVTGDKLSKLAYLLKLDQSLTKN